MHVWRNTAASAHKTPDPGMQKHNEYLKKGRRENSSGGKKKKKSLFLKKGLTLAGGVEESFRGYLGHT